MLDLTFLSSLIAIADTGSIAAAARLTGRPPSTIATHIERLSYEIGRPLIQRAGRTVRLTDDGAMLAARGRNLLRSHDDALALFGAGKGLASLRLGMPETVRSSAIIGALKTFKEECGGQVEVRVAPSAALRRMLHHGEIDVAIALANDSTKEDTLWTDNLVWVGTAPEGSELLPIVSYPVGCPYREIMENQLADAGLAWIQSFAAGSTATLIEAVSAGLGVSVMDRKAARRAGLQLSSLKFLPDLPKPRFTLLARKPGREARRLMEVIEKSLNRF